MCTEQLPICYICSVWLLLLYMLCVCVSVCCILLLPFTRLFKNQAKNTIFKFKCKGKACRTVFRYLSAVKHIEHIKSNLFHYIDQMYKSRIFPLQPNVIIQILKIRPKYKTCLLKHGKEQQIT